MELFERFFPLMSEALHCSGTPEGLALPLEDVQARLVRLADQERASVPESGIDRLPDFSEARRQDLDLCRFAVCAWVDEKLLNAPRQDAAAWMPLSLQCRYFGTTEAGQRFFTYLDGLLDGFGLSAQENGEPVDLARRLELAGGFSPDAAGMGVLQVFALCLLYGFRGRLYGQPDLLARVRKACYGLIAVRDLTSAEQVSPRRETGKAVLHGLEPVAYVLVPIVTCVAFGLYCADILSNIPIKVF